MADAPKRAHDPPTGQTPGKKQPKRRSTSGKFLKRDHCFQMQRKRIMLEWRRSESKKCHHSFPDCEIEMYYMLFGFLKLLITNIN